MALNRHALILSQGDPGLFDVFKRLGKAAIGFATGGPTGAVRAILQPSTRPSQRVQTFADFAGPTVSRPPIGQVSRPSGGTIPIISIPGVRGALQQFFPGGETGLQVAGSALGVPAMNGGGCASGFHPNKSSYMTRAGFVEKGTKCVRNRRRNLSNGRANTRALRRMAAWDKQERKLGKTMKAIARGR